LITKDINKSLAIDLLEQANKVALSTWRALKPESHDSVVTDWSTAASNNPAGKIVIFWLFSLDLLMQEKSGEELSLLEDYQKWFEMVLNDQTLKGGLGCSMLTSQISFLFKLSQTWVTDRATIQRT